MPKKREIVFGVTGSIAAYRACDIVSGLRNAGYNISVIMTECATKFVAPLSFQTLSQNRVYLDLFAPVDDWNPSHTSLADKADLVLIAPATANFIAKIAHGMADDLLSSTVLATRAKVLIAPAMNIHMYGKDVVKENIARMKKQGHRFIGPVTGRLACGYTGMGCLAAAGDIIKEAKGMLKTG